MTIFEPGICSVICGPVGVIAVDGIMLATFVMSSSR